MLWCDRATEVFSSTLAWFHLALVFESMLPFFTTEMFRRLDDVYAPTVPNKSDPNTITFKLNL